MRRMLMLAAGVLVGGTMLTATSPARALMVAPAPLSDRLVTAANVVVGKVIAIEDKTVEASSAPGVKEKSTYQVAVVKISDSITGVKGLTSIRVGFMPPMVQPPAPGGRIRGSIRRFPQVNLTVGQEAIFFLQPHHEKDFQIAPQYFSVVDKKNNENFDKDVTFLKRCAKLLEEPAAGLKAKDAQDRWLTAGLLLTRYRTPSGPGPFKQEPIDAEQSQLILQALADADWGQRDPLTQMSAPMVFGRLGLTPQDGWKPGPFKNYAVEFPAAAKKWLKDHAGTYRVQRFVTEKKKD